MFGKKNNDAQKNTLNTGSNPNAINSIVAGTVVEGIVSSESDFRVDGKIIGKLTCNAKVIIGPSGLVEGEIKCDNALIEGTFTGKLRVNDMLIVKETANVQGDVHTGKLAISAGAIFNVVCDMGENSKSSNKNSNSTNGAVPQKVG